ncbi:MAG: hypothetical protein H0W16_01290, partial [Actinobacteria bacterium]|nr:hypothetical protein [Actinomycetota bacterium]
SGALWSTGERARADETLGSALAVASASGDERLTWHARLERTSRHGLAHEHDAEDLLSVAEEARAVFERTGDGLGLARAWRRIAVVHLLHGRFGRAVEADEQALEHAARVGHGREESRIVDTLCTALLYGPVPADEAIARCEELLERARGRPALEAAVLSSLAGLVAMRCRFDEARDMYRRARRLWEELGLRYAVAGLTQVGGEIELLAGCADEAERELRVGAEILEPVGGAPLQSALLARALARQGQVDQADALALRALDAAGGHEIQAEVIALATRAAIAAADGRDGEALALAQAAVGRSQEADAPNLHADALVALARCHAAGGRTDDSATALHRSLLAYAAKGNLAATERLTRAGVSSLSSA